MAYTYLYGYFAQGTPDGTYNFTPDLTMTVNYTNGTKGEFPITNGTLDPITIGKANPGTMEGAYANTLEKYERGSLDLDHAGFYSSAIADDTGVTGFLTGIENKPNINDNRSMPFLAVNFMDTTVNQTNSLRKYTLTLPKNWKGDVTDICFSTAGRGTVSNSNNEAGNGPFIVTLDNGQIFTVDSLLVKNPQITAQLEAGAHIQSVAGEAEILAGNNISAYLKNAVIEDGTYQNEEIVPFSLHVHSVTSDTDIEVVGHLKYFDKTVENRTQFSFQGSLDYNLGSAYTAGQSFLPKYDGKPMWLRIKREDTLVGEKEGSLVFPQSLRKGFKVQAKLPTFIVSSFANRMIDLDFDKLKTWCWTDPETGTKYYPEITDLGINSETGEHQTKLDFSKYTVGFEGSLNEGVAAFYPPVLAFKVSNMALTSKGSTTYPIVEMHDNNGDDLHPKYGGRNFYSRVPINWTITAPTIINSQTAISGARTGLNTYYIADNGTAGFDRGLKNDTGDDHNEGIIHLAIVNNTATAFSSPQSVAVLPRKSEGAKFDLVLTGEAQQVNGEGVKVLYSEKLYDLPEEDSGQQVDLSGSDWLTADQVTDWSKIRTVAASADSLRDHTSIEAKLPIAVGNIQDTTIGQLVTMTTYDYAGSIVDGAGLSTRTNLRAGIWGTPSITVHYETSDDGTTSSGTALAEPVVITGENTDGKNPAYKRYTTQNKDIEGYIKAGLAKDSAPAAGVLNDITNDVTYLYISESSAKLPNTGGIGTYLFYALGGLLVALGIYGWVRKNRKVDNAENQERE